MATSEQDPIFGPAETAGNDTKAGMTQRFIALGVMMTLAIVSALAGAALDRLVVRPSTTPPSPAMGQPGGRGARSGGPNGPGGGPGNRGGGGSRFIDQQLTGVLTLTPAQRVAIDSAMQQQFRDFEAARSGVQPQLDSILKATRTKVEAILTPAQRAALPRGPTLEGPGFGGDRGGGRSGRGGRGRGGPPGAGGPPPDRSGGGKPTITQRIPSQ